MLYGWTNSSCLFRWITYLTLPSQGFISIFLVTNLCHSSRFSTSWYQPWVSIPVIIPLTSHMQQVVYLMFLPWFVVYNAYFLIVATVGLLSQCPSTLNCFDRSIPDRCVLWLWLRTYLLVILTYWMYFQMHKCEKKEFFFIFLASPLFHKQYVGDAYERRKRNKK